MKLNLFSQGLRPVAKIIYEKKDQGIQFQVVSLFERVDTSGSHDPGKVVSKASLFRLNPVLVSQVLTGSPQNITFSIPLDENETIDLDLTRVNIFTPDFRIQRAGNPSEDIAIPEGLHFRGIIAGDSNSICAISIFGNEVMGIVSTLQSGNMVLGKLNGDPDNTHIFYRESDLLIRPSFDCHTEDFPGAYTPFSFSDCRSMP